MNLTLKHYLDGIENKQFSAQEILDKYLQKAHDLNPKLNAFVRFHEEYAKDHVGDFSQLPLKGAPIAIKDIILTKGYITSCASKMLEDFVSPYSATCFEKLEKAGGLMIGKANMDEFAMGGSTETSYFGKTLNPHGTNRVPGGSSGGSAAAVAADMCVAALGTDTGGSVRQPASFCGIVGIKPTYGRVSRYGVQAMASSLDQVGVMTKTVDDAELLLRSISGYDDKDAQSDPQSDTFLPCKKDVKQLKVALPKEALAEGLDPDVKSHFLNVIDQLRKAGITIEEVDMPILSYAVPMYYTIMPAEVSTNLSRFDGIKFGLQSDTLTHDSLFDYYSKIRSEGFGDEVKRRILLGTFVLSSANYEGFYLKAQQARQQLISDMNKVFGDYDLIITPTAPEVAWRIGEKISDPLKMYLEDLYTIPANMAGLPAMSVPAGTIENHGEKMPFGIHLMANKWQEMTIFTLAKYIESIFKN